MLTNSGNTYAGTTTVGSGTTLNVGNGTGAGTLGAGAVTVDGTLKIDRNSNYTLSSVASSTTAISGSGTVDIKTTGQLTLDRSIELTTGSTLNINSTNTSGNSL